MDSSSRTRRYDLFKLLVALILFLLLLLLLKPGQRPPPPVTVTPKPATNTPVTATETPQPATDTPTSTETVTATPTETPITATPTETPITVTPPSPTPTPETGCPGTLPARLQVGMTALTRVRLNLRSSPGIQHNWILTMMANTRVEVIGGPECRPHPRGAYLWWQVRLPNGQTGWSAEASITRTRYFLEPLER